MDAEPAPGGSSPYAAQSPFRPRAQDPLLQRTIPVSEHLRHYGAGTARGDVVAGVNVAALALPSAMAYAEVAGVTPVNGLYALLLVYGLVPRAVLVAWGALVLCLVVGFLGQLLGLPEWVRDLSPFEHVPSVPAAEFELAPLLALTAIAAALLAAGISAFRHRDIG